MGPGDSRWTLIWSREKYPRIHPNFFVYGYGTDSEPHTSHWMASLLDPLGRRFKEGVRILDYGCGAGRLCNFISGHLRDFLYFGAEPPGSPALPVARSYFEKDSRVAFGDIGSPEELEAVNTYDAAILGSIFTHLRPETSEDILRHLWPFVTRGGMIIFTIIVGDELRIGNPNAYGFQDCYQIVCLPWSWIEDMEKTFGHEIRKVDSFQAGGSRHEIMTIAD